MISQSGYLEVVGEIFLLEIYFYYVLENNNKHKAVKK